MHKGVKLKPQYNPRRKASRGMFSAFAGAIALVLLYYVASLSGAALQANSTSAQMIASHETAFKTDNTIRLLDKALADGMHDSLNGSCTPASSALASTYFNSTLTSANSKSAVQCKFTNSGGADTAPTFTIPGSAPASMKATGYLECSVNLNDRKIIKRVQFNFKKEAALSGSACIVYDSASRCTEQPGFDLACAN